MAKGMNLLANEFKNELSEVINNSQLPVIVIKYVLNDVLNEINNIVNVAVQQEYQMHQEELAKEAEKTSKGEVEDKDEKNNI